MMPSSAQFAAIINALNLVLPLTAPADLTLRQFFRDRRELGSRDRGLVAEAVYAVLRRRRLLEALTPRGTPREMALLGLIKLHGKNLRELEPLLEKNEAEWLAKAKAVDVTTLPFAVQADLPDWIAEKILDQYGETETLALAQSLREPAPLDLRVNTLTTTREQVLRQFATEAIAAAPTRYSPFGVRLGGKPALQTHPLFLSGKIEVQDEGSQLLGMLVAPKRREMVIDFCAGAGGKTLLLGAAMHSQGRVYAFDVSEKRLNNLKARLKRSGLSNVQPQLIDGERDARVKRLAGKIDRVLVDAPCSGLGRLRRNPDLKGRQTAAGVAERVAKQQAILASAATLLKPGGRLVYGTCSLLREENEDIVEAFLRQYPAFKLQDAEAILAAQGVAIDCGPLFKLFPHRHGTDGFFAAVFERNAVVEQARETLS